MLNRLVCMVVLATSFLVAGSVAAEDYRRMRPSRFPAYLESLTFPNGSVLDKGRSLRLGAWIVRFGDKKPRVVGTSPRGSLIAVAIHDLVCTNAVPGDSDCSMFIGWGLPFDEPC